MCTPHPLLFGGSNREEWDGWGIQHVWGRGETYASFLLGKTERPRRRWEDNIKIDPKEVEIGSMDWIDVAQVRDRWPALVNAVMYLRVPQNMGHIYLRHGAITVGAARNFV